jgi:hypothetical protein
MPRKPAAPEQDDGAVAQLASSANVDPSSLESLLAEVERLKKELGVKDEALSNAQKAALEQAESQSMLQSNGIQPVPTGRTVMAERLDVGNPEYPTGYKTVGYKDGGRKILEPQFAMKPVDTYYIKIDIPPMAGWDMKINGLPIVHGAVYEVDLGVLQYLQDMQWRAWEHERVLNGKNENIFRRPLEKRIGSRA